MLFQAGKLTVGIVLPIQSRDGGRDIDFGLQLELAARADALGFSALWVRDVPLNSASYPDPVGHSDPWVLLGALSASTRSITLATGAIVLPLRHPLHIAKAALSMDALSSGRFLLGLGSGDRPSEFAAFGRNVEERRELFRGHWVELASALGGQVNGGTDFEIRPRSGRQLPLVAVGSSSQSLEWIARNAAAWMTYHRPLAAQKDRIALWHNAVARSTTEFRGLGQAMALELVDTTSDSIEEINLGYRTGPDGLYRALTDMRDLGVHHVALDLAVDRHKALSDLDIIARDVLPRLASG
ncbi:TIGR03571 family LLM class oxidoreductase [Aliirhizobium terrae]|uniref:TIGR03571 family LLM class oxidoreductase n=1 Tax=Terrirhizobium terrae TaxID=2926709 RepID=UPI002577F2BA|nr:TIGR03571 family LLM class oxidoreductase [Rhizobium sp. CC-CFT758]WJH40518.1 TIGR03571 family LLM class oxidoreductase [Rhizobium sp. CC-CFT758]